MVTDNRDAYRAGISGARSYPGNPDSFRRGQDSAKEFRRNQRYKKPSNKRYASNRPSKLEQGIKRFGNNAGAMAKDFGNAGKTGIKSIYDAAMQFGKYIGDTQARAKQNEKILGDAYSDEAKMSLMTGFGLREGQEGYEGSDQAFYNKYRKLGDMLSGKEAEEKYKIADSAFNNAQITNRMNYGLGQLGEDTLFKEGYDSYRNSISDEISPRFNMENFMGGIDATPAGKAFMAEANKAQDKEVGDSLIGNELANYNKAESNYGQRDVLLDQNVPAQDKFYEQFDIAEALTPLQKYLLQSQAQGRGGFEEDSNQAMINAGFDMDYIGPTTRMRFTR